MKPRQLANLDLDNYSNHLSLAQVIAYFDRLGILFKPTTIQNYVRVGVLPPVVNRKYSKQHLVYLALIYHLRDSISLEALKQLFERVNFGEDAEPLIAFYNLYRQFHMDTAHQFADFVSGLTGQVSEQLSQASPGHAPEKNHLMMGLLLSSLSGLIKAHNESVSD